MINLGDEVVDKVSGFRGVVISRHEYLNGCVRFSVQPKVGADGKLPDSAGFDEPQLDVAKKCTIRDNLREARAKPPGGPGKFEDTPRPSGERNTSEGWGNHDV